VEKTLELSDGRRIGYGEYGRHDGTPVLYFHGSPGCRINATLTLAHQLANRAGGPKVRLITLERPGYGLSDPVEHYSLQAWTRDVNELVDELHLERFAIVGISGGGPFALAVAHGIPERVTKVAIQCGMGPLEVSSVVEALSPAMKQIVFASIHATQQVEAFIQNLGQNVESFVRMQLAELTDVDKQVISEDLVDVTIESLKESTKNPSGYVNDFKILARPWGVPLHEIRVPVQLWYSDADRSVPFVHGEYLASAIPGAVLKRLNGYTHLPTAIASLPEVLQFLEPQI
jgi:pimeloyl-ACP methyl ester carboxylesterase